MAETKVLLSQPASCFLRPQLRCPFLEKPSLTPFLLVESGTSPVLCFPCPSPDFSGLSLRTGLPSLEWDFHEDRAQIHAGHCRVSSPTQHRWALLREGLHPPTQ